MGARRARVTVRIVRLPGFCRIRGSRGHRVRRLRCPGRAGACASCFWPGPAQGLIALQGDLAGLAFLQRCCAGSGLLGISCIPVTIGLAFIVLSFFNKNKG